MILKKEKGGVVSDIAFFNRVPIIKFRQQLPLETLAHTHGD